MKAEYKNLSDLFLPYIKYAVKRYIDEQAEHVKIFSTNTQEELEKELKLFIDLADRNFLPYPQFLFTEWDKKMYDEYQDPDTFMFSQMYEVVDKIIVSTHQATEITNKSFKHDLICIFNFLENYFEDELLEPDPYSISWRPTEVNGFTASTMIREELPLMNGDDVALTSKYDELKRLTKENNKLLFQRAMIRTLSIGTDFSITDIEFLVENLDSLWV